MRAGAGLRVVAVAVTVAGMLAGCSSGYDAEDVAYAGDYGSHPALAVVGYPSTGSLGITQQVVWRMADGKADELAALVADKEEKGVPEKTAANWIAAFGKGARGKVTAEFYDEGSLRQEVVLYLHDTGQIKQIQVRATRVDDKDVWRVTMDEPTPEEATTVHPWVPKKPGELGSRTGG